MRLAYAGLAALAFGIGGAASAAPMIPHGDLSLAPAAEPVAPWRYDRRCGWRDGRWVVDLGAGKIVLCRPYRPSRSWIWYKEGNREGWYDRRHKKWHHNKW